MLRQGLSGRDLLQLVVVIKIVIEPSPRDHESHLLLHKPVIAHREYIRYLLGIVKLDGHSQGQWVHLVLEVQSDAYCQVHHLVGLRGSKVCEALQVKADAREGRLLAERDDALDAVHLAQKVDRVTLCIVRHVKGDNLLDQVKQLLHILLLLCSFAELLRNLARQIPDVFVAPTGQPLLSAVEPVLQALTGPLLLHRGGENGKNISEEALEATLRHLRVVLGERWIVGPQKLQRLGNRSH
mmetsp:Transcript_90614/g.270382  ORF Transcript_90614/g.270382 Transcript_90614/m.270382 type:complete len:240 (+) Transcript_90614:1798-2517(+)